MPQDFDEGKQRDEHNPTIPILEEDEEQEDLDTQEQRVITIALPPEFADTPIRPRFDLSRPFHERQ